MITRIQRISGWSKHNWVLIYNIKPLVRVASHHLTLFLKKKKKKNLTSNYRYLNSQPVISFPTEISASCLLNNQIGWPAAKRHEISTGKTYYYKLNVFLYFKHPLSSFSKIIFYRRFVHLVPLKEYWTIIFVL